METYDNTYTMMARLPPFYEDDLSLAYILHSPADLRVTDPDGNVVALEGNSPAGMVAWRGDIEGDGEEEEIVAFADPALGDYQVEVIPFADADPNALLTLDSVLWGQMQTLLDNVPVADLPGSPIIVNVARRTLAVTVDPLTTSNSTPALHGTVDDPHVVVAVTVAGNTYEAVNNSDGTWTLPDDSISPSLAPGVYQVQAVAMDGFGNQGTDATTNELRISNSPPVLDPSDAMMLASINMNETDNPGTLATEIIASAGGDRITDPDPDALEGIAIVAVDRNHGAWEYSTDDGSTWFDVGSPSDAAALLLASDAGSRVRFVPDQGYVGTLVRGITFRAWDQTIGSNGQTVDVWNSGDGTAFSTLVATASITVLAANHPPAEIVLDNTEVKENRPGDVIGSLTVVDEDANDTHMFSVADSRFEVSDGKLKLKAGVCLDEVVDAGLGVEVTATDDGGLSLTRTLTLTVLKNDFPWSPVLPRDVDGNGMVQAVDVLIVINEINARGIRPLPVPPPAIPAFCFDAAPNNVLEAADVLAVINHINSHPAAGGEAESAADALLAAVAAEAPRWQAWPLEQVADQTLGPRPSLCPFASRQPADPLPRMTVTRLTSQPAELKRSAKPEREWEADGFTRFALDDVVAEIAEDVSAVVAARPGSHPHG